MSSRLALGTVQFGMKYGVANESGQVSLEEARRIVGRARAAGIDTLQTAIGYGDSEERLGAIGIGAWHVVTKVPAVPPGTASVGEWLQSSVRGSLDRLCVARVDTLLLHRGEDLLEPFGAELYEGLRRLRDGGTIGRIGVSIYEPAELDVLLPRFDIQHVQAPFNLVDRRLEQSGWLARLHEGGVEVHVRSVFLQGLLLMPPERRPARFERWHPLWRRWDSWLISADVDALHACLGFALGFPEIDRILVGVDTAMQLEEIVAAAKRGALAVPGDLASDDVELVNPVHWAKP